MVDGVTKSGRAATEQPPATKEAAKVAKAAAKEVVQAVQAAEAARVARTVTVADRPGAAVPAPPRRGLLCCGSRGESD